MHIPKKRNHNMPEGIVINPGKIYSVQCFDNNYLITVYNSVENNFFGMNISEGMMQSYMHSFDVSRTSYLVGVETDCIYHDKQLVDFVVLKPRNILAGTLRNVK